MKKKLIGFGALVFSLFALASCGDETTTANNVETTTPTESAHTHTIVNVDGKAATCTEDGYTDSSYCSECNTVIKDKEVIPMTGHNYEKLSGEEHISNKVMVGDYCVKADYDTACSACDATGKETVEGYWYFEKKPTLTEEGSIRIVQADGTEIALKTIGDYSIPVPNLTSTFWKVTATETKCAGAKVSVEGLTNLNPAPPVGPFYGGKGYNIVKFISLYNAIVKDTLKFETTLEEFHDIDDKTGICKNCGETQYLEADASRPIVDIEADDFLTANGEQFNVIKITNAVGGIQILKDDSVSNGTILNVQDEAGNTVNFNAENSHFTALEGKTYFVKVYDDSFVNYKYTVKQIGKRSNWNAGLYLLSKASGGIKQALLYSAKIMVEVGTHKWEATIKFKEEYIFPGDMAAVELVFDSPTPLADFGDCFKFYAYDNESSMYKFAGYVDLTFKALDAEGVKEHTQVVLSNLGTYVDAYYYDTNGNLYYYNDDKLVVTQDPRDVCGFDAFFDCIDDAGYIYFEDLFDIYAGKTEAEMKEIFVGKTVKVLEGGTTVARDAVIADVVFDDYFGCEYFKLVDYEANEFDNVMYIYIER